MRNVRSLTFNWSNGWKWWPGMSHTRTGWPTSFSHPSTTCFGLLRSPSQRGMTAPGGRSEGLNPSRERSNAILGGTNRSSIWGLYRPKIWVLKANCVFISLWTSEPAWMRASRPATLSSKALGSGTWFMGLGESIRRRPFTSTPAARSCLAIS